MSFKPKVDPAYWWWFSANLYTASDKGLIWWLKVGTNIVWVIAFAFLISFSSRIIAGNPDVVGTGAVILNTVLGLLVSRGILLGASGWFEHAMDSLGIRRSRGKYLELTISIAMLLISLTIFQELPVISALYYNKAEASYKSEIRQDFRNIYYERKESKYKPEFERSSSNPDKNFRRSLYTFLINRPSKDAKADYFRASKFDPKNWYAFNRLGEMYEDLQEFDQAFLNYQLATDLAVYVDKVYPLINISRFHITKDNIKNIEDPYLIALGILRYAENWINELIDDPNVMKSQKDIQQYNFFTHKGWAYFKIASSNEKSMPLLEKAQENISKAIGIMNSMEDDVSKKIIEPHLSLCIQAEISQSKSNLLSRQNLESEWSSCASEISAITRPLRLYESTWITRNEKNLLDF